LCYSLVHGLSESGADTPEERVDDDCLQVAAMLSELNITGAQVEKVIRLGKRSTDAAETNKLRPLKIVFDSEESKVQLLRNAKKPEKQEGGRLGESSCGPRSHSKTEGSTKQIGSRTEKSFSPGQNGSHNIPRRSGEEERILTLHNNLRCLDLNARSIISKFYLFEAWISNIRPDIIGVTESWTSGDILDSELSLDGYDLFRKDRLVARAGGDVLLYVKCSLSPVVFSPNTKLPEHVWFQISDSGVSKFLIGVCYRTPSNDIFGD